LAATVITLGLNRLAAETSAEAMLHLPSLTSWQLEISSAINAACGFSAARASPERVLDSFISAPILYTADQAFVI